VYEKITILKFYELYDLGNNILINLEEKLFLEEIRV
jgi:hypothetical protein